MNWNSANAGVFLRQNQGTVPALNAAGTRTSAAIDRWLGAGNKCDSAVLAASLGAVAGAPTSFTYDAKLQDSPDGSTGWADYVPDVASDGTATSGAIATQTAANAFTAKLVNVTNARRYLRVFETVAFVGGTSPTVAGSTQLTLGGAAQQPIGP